MKTVATVALLALALAGCGADGPPERPEPRPVDRTGVNVTISGSAEMGVSGRW